MKGVNKRVIEITEPENEYIERVLVFMKPNKGDVRLARQRAEAERFASRLVCVKRRPGLTAGLIAASLAVLAFAAFILAYHFLA